MIFKNGQTYFIKLAVWTPQDLQSMLGHFSTLYAWKDQCNDSKPCQGFFYWYNILFNRDKIYFGYSLVILSAIARYELSVSVSLSLSLSVSMNLNVDGEFPICISVSLMLCLVRNHLFSTYATFSEKLAFLAPWYAHISVRIRG